GHVPKTKVCTQSSTATGKTSCALRSRWTLRSTRTSLMRRLQLNPRVSMRLPLPHARKPLKQQPQKRLPPERAHHVVRAAPVVDKQLHAGTFHTDSFSQPSI